MMILDTSMERLLPWISRKVRAVQVLRRRKQSYVVEDVNIYYENMITLLIHWNVSKKIYSGDLVEKGLMRRLPEGFDGNTCPYIFTWSTERPNKTWGMGSGCAPYYNTCKEGTANTRMDRFFDEDRFEIYATEDIKAGDELLHTYISLKWRTCFAELNEIVHKE